MRLGAAITVVCFAIAISACGDDEDEGTLGEEATELLDHVPGGQPRLIFADFAAAREQLGLPEDAVLADFPAGDEAGNVGRQRLATTASLILPYLSIPPRQGPLRKAIDQREIAAVASNAETGAPGVTVLRTSQSFEDIAATLERRGYTRDGNVAVHTKLEHKVRDGQPRSRGSVEVLERGEQSNPAPLKAGVVRRLFSYPVVADGGDGLIVLGYSRRTVESGVAGSAGSDQLARALLERVDGVARGSVATVVDSTNIDCVQGLAVGESFDPERAELTIEIDGEASGDRFRLPELEKPRLEYSEPEAEDRVLTAEITGGLDAGDTAVRLPLDLLTAALDPRRIYEC